MTDPPATLIFDPARYQTRTIPLNNSVITVRAYENISYVTKPLDPATQVMNIYVPEAYFRGEPIGSWGNTGVRAQHLTYCYAPEAGREVLADTMEEEIKPFQRAT